MNTRRLFTATATSWLLAWQRNASLARLSRDNGYIPQARIHAMHARTCLGNFRVCCGALPWGVNFDGPHR